MCNIINNKLNKVVKPVQIFICIRDDFIYFKNCFLKITELSSKNKIKYNKIRDLTLKILKNINLNVYITLLCNTAYRSDQLTYSVNEKNISSVYSASVHSVHMHIYTHKLGSQCFVLFSWLLWVLHVHSSHLYNYDTLFMYVHISDQKFFFQKFIFTCFYGVSFYVS